MNRILAFGLAVAIVGCIPDFGAKLVSDAGPFSDVVSEDTPGHDHDGAREDAGEDAGIEPDAEPDAESDAGSTGPLCDDSAPSQEVDRYVWGENFTFYFTPAGAEITTLYVPANALVHFSLAGSTNEEVHIWGITLEDCETPKSGIGQGTEGNESTYDWKAPRIVGTYPFGGKCLNHEGMDFDIVVTE